MPPTARYVAAVTPIDAPAKWWWAASGSAARNRRRRTAASRSRRTRTPAGSLGGLLVVEFDQPGDRARARRHVRPLALQPVARGPRVGVGAGDQPVGPAGGEQAPAGGVHAGAAGSAGAVPGTLDRHHVEPQPRRAVGDDLRRAIVTVVEHDDRRERLTRQRLGAERLQTAADPALLVAGGDDDDGL
ncbi:MAG: hypothetical protein ABSH51_24720 [Solirubrobacteraceae bacterium]|jgi:hypothetical protein